MITKAIDNAFERALSQNWWEIYVAIDIHGTIFPSTYDTSAQRKFLPGAKEALTYLSEREDVKLFLYSCSTLDEYTEVVDFLYDNGIMVDSIGMSPVTHLEDAMTVTKKYATKPYYNILLDDKAGFHPEEWEEVLRTFRKYPQLPTKS